MAWFKVRPGQVCGVSGVDLPEGTIIELPERIGREVADKLEPCTEAGEPIGRPPEASVAEVVTPAEDREEIDTLRDDEA